MCSYSEKERTSIMLDERMAHCREEIRFSIIVIIISIWCDHISLVYQILEEKYLFCSIEWTFLVAFFHMSLVKANIEYCAEILWLHKSIHRMRWIHVCWKLVSIPYFFGLLRVFIGRSTYSSSMIRVTSASVWRRFSSRSSSSFRIFWKFAWKTIFIA